MFASLRSLKVSDIATGYCVSCMVTLHTVRFAALHLAFQDTSGSGSVSSMSEPSSDPRAYESNHMLQESNNIMTELHESNNVLQGTCGIIMVSAMQLAHREVEQQSIGHTVVIATSLAAGHMQTV